MCNRLKMGRIDTALVETQMVKLQAVWNLTLCILVDETMRTLGFVLS